MISKKKIGLHPKNVMKSGVSHKNTNLGLDLHSSSPEPVKFFGAQSSLGGAQFSFGGAQAVIWGGTAPVCSPRGAESDSVSIANMAVHYIVKTAHTTANKSKLFVRFIDDILWISEGLEDTAAIE